MRARIVMAALAGVLLLHAHVAAALGVPYMVKDINPGAASSSPLKLLSLGNMLFFAATDGTTGFEPMVSDGTEGGTFQLRDLWPGSNSSMQQGCLTCNAIAIGSTAYFSAPDGGVGGSQLWRSDGTTGGTQKVLANASASDLVDVGGKVFFAGIPVGFSVASLWTSDGTTPGTAEVGSPIFLSGIGMAEFNGMAYFQADDGGTGNELWRSDGTAAGTVLVSALAQGTSSAYPMHLTRVGGSLFFRAYGDVGEGLCVTQGSLAGTTFLKQVHVGVSETAKGQIVNLNGTALFIGDDGSGDFELWRSNGTPAGTVRVKDIYPGPSGSLNSSSLVVMGNAVYFAANDGAHGVELWKSDGTDAGTVMLKDLYPQFGAFGHGSPAGLANIRGTLFFRATTSSASGTQPWVSDGTEAGTVQLAEIYPGGGSQADSFTEVNGTVYFTATDGVHGVELWGVASPTVGVEPPAARSPRSALLAPARPNPACGEARIAYTLASAQRVRLDLLDTQGRRVRTLADGVRSSGTHEVALDGRKLAGGLYFYRLETEAGAETRKVMLTH